MAHQLLGILPDKEVRLLPEFNLLVKKTPQKEGYERLPYLVQVWGDETAYQYDPETGKFYVDITNQEAMFNQLQEHKELKDKMIAEGKSTEEIDEYFAGKGTIFYDRKEIVFVPNLDEQIQELIKLI